MSHQFPVIRDEHTAPYNAFEGNDISALDQGRFDYPASSSAASIHDRSGNKVSEDAESDARPGGRVLLAALDFNRDEHLTAVLKEAKAVAKPVDTVILFSALNTEKHPEEKGKADARVKEILGHAADFPEGTRVLTHVVYAKAHEIVLQVAKKHNVQLIILGKRNLRGLKKLTANSVSDQVIEAAPCSVLIAKGS